MDGETTECSKGEVVCNGKELRVGKGSASVVWVEAVLDVIGKELYVGGNDIVT